MITFADYMNRVLYGPAGYYATGAAKSGKSGDYFTAPDVGPVFGQLLAEIFSSWRERLRSSAFAVVEAGAGEGRLAEDILKARPFRYLAVERSASRRAVLEKLKEKTPTFDVYESLTAIREPFDGVLFGNELIDAFPVHRVRMTSGQLRELFVEEAGDRRRFIWREPSTPRLQAYFDRIGVTFPQDYETEVNLGMATWLAGASAAMRKGLVVLIDYGRPAHDYYAPERSRGTLRAFSKHKVSADFLDPAGMVDLTSDVDFSSLALDAKDAGFVPLAFMEMGTFLMQGVEKVMRDEGRGTSPSSLITRPSALKYLLHPEGMGAAFHVLILGKGVDPAEWIFEHNRLKRL